MPQADTAIQALVVGAGYTGRRLLDALPRDAALGIGRSRPDRFSGRFGFVDLDADDGLPYGQFAPAFPVVYTVPPATGTGTRIRRLFSMLPGTPGRFVYLSTSGVYGDRKGDVVDESAVPQPGSERAKRRLKAEQHLGKLCGEQGIELVILRVPGIYGPGRLGVEGIVTGRPVLAEEDAHPGNRIHVDDLVACCLAALDVDRPAGIYNVGDGDHRSATWFTFEVARQAGLPLPQTIRRKAATHVFSERRLSFLRESRQLDVRRMRDELRPALRYQDPVAGIAASLAAEREQGIRKR